jgi:drug/metabolite transporter (DMT)-like permease
VIAGLALFALLFTAIGWWPRVASGLRDRRSMAQTALGSFFGPFLGVSLSLISIQVAQTGVAAALMGTTPLVVLAYVALVRRETVGWSGCCGALMAVVGVALLFLN